MRQIGKKKLSTDLQKQACKILQPSKITNHNHRLQNTFGSCNGYIWRSAHRCQINVTSSAYYLLKTKQHAQCK